MTRRYFVPDLQNFVGEIDLPSEEAYHAARVMRVRVGETITLFDGQGAEAPATVIDVSKRDVRVTMSSPQFKTKELDFPVIIACPLPKGDRAKWLVEKLTEIGVSALWPIETERTQGIAGHSTTQLDKLRRTVVESSKQCERNVLMQIEQKEHLGALASTPCSRFIPSAERGETPSVAPNFHRLMLAPGAPNTLGEYLRKVEWFTAVPGERNSHPPCICLLAGPEGGLSDAEVQLCEKNGWQPVSLGKSILRIETAVLAAASRIAFG